MWQDRWIVSPTILGFGVQVALYVILKKRIFMPVDRIGPSSVKNTGGVVTGASGATSTIAMAACCAHHVTDVLPILGLTAVATFLAEFRLVFMWVGLVTTLVGIVVMLVILFKERHKVIHMISFSTALEAE
jgi:hypothetical protein